MINTRKKVGLALGSGGARGIAHVGVIKSLLENNIPIDYIAGTSIGAWVGAYYAIHQDIEKLEYAAIEYKREKLFALFEPSFKGGLVKGKKVTKVLKQSFGDKTFEDLKTPLSVVTTDLISGKELIINSGLIVPAVQASMAIPLMFQPVRYKEALLVDGGLINPLPDDVARGMGADVVIAVNLDHDVEANQMIDKKITLKKTAVRSSQIIRHYLSHYSATDAEIVIKPELPELGLIAMKDYILDRNSDKLVVSGKVATEKNIEHIKQLINNS
ncbi:MAG: patatin-like phospholipase family protein [bacterium]|nr:patatin-like phospholipase family protein [bacterium]